MNRTHWFRRIVIGLKAIRQLGLAQVSAYALYELGLRSGHFQRVVAREARRQGVPEAAVRLESHLRLPGREVLLGVMGQDGLGRLRTEADEIVTGNVRLFGGEARPLRLDSPSPLRPWTAYARGQLPNIGDEKQEEAQDIKFLWEPARMGWAFTLGRAYLVTGEERYPATFWRLVEAFDKANPFGMGVHWASAQEVAMRLIAMAFGWHAMRGSLHSNHARTTWLGGVIAIHAGRIPVTLSYARAQRNNHLLAEAAGLLTAGLFLPGHPKSREWRESGWRWLLQGLRDQIAADGAYIQHSTQYHRLMLQLALWASALASNAGMAMSAEAAERLAQATRWLLEVTDPSSGWTPILGPNDSADLLPLSACQAVEFRPVLQAAGWTFLGKKPFPAGPWDEPGAWLWGEAGPPPAPETQRARAETETTPHMLRSPERHAWAYLRAARFTSRPGHADQLHLDLWWRGMNLARDPGTYRYTAPPPWDNALASALAHNTLTVNNEEPMLRAGRFLWLDASQARLLGRDGDSQAGWERLVAEQDGYRRLGVLHQRSVTAFKAGRWLVEDRLLPLKPKSAVGAAEQRALVHWLLPDWPWEMAPLEAGQAQLRLVSPHGVVSLTLAAWRTQEGENVALPLELQLLRAGEMIYGSGEAPPILGWSSPRYGVKEPALSLRLAVTSSPPLTISTNWDLPK